MLEGLQAKYQFYTSQAEACKLMAETQVKWMEELTKKAETHRKLLQRELDVFPNGCHKCQRHQEGKDSQAFAQNLRISGFLNGGRGASIIRPDNAVNDME